MSTPHERRRYSQCDDTCTTDCGPCKGAGHPGVAALARLLDVYGLATS